MKKYKVECGFVTIVSGELELSPEQYSAREHALEKTKEKNVYLVTGKCGFKRGETFGFNGDDTALVKAGMVAPLSSGTDSEKAEEPEATADHSIEADDEEGGLFRKGKRVK